MANETEHKLFPANVKQIMDSGIPMHKAVSYAGLRVPAKPKGK